MGADSEWCSAKRSSASAVVGAIHPHYRTYVRKWIGLLGHSVLEVLAWCRKTVQVSR